TFPFIGRYAHSLDIIVTSYPLSIRNHAVIRPLTPPPTTRIRLFFRVGALLVKERRTPVVLAAFPEPRLVLSIACRSVLFHNLSKCSFPPLNPAAVNFNASNFSAARSYSPTALFNSSKCLLAASKSFVRSSTAARDSAVILAFFSASTLAKTVSSLALTLAAMLASSRAFWAAAFPSAHFLSGSQIGRDVLKLSSSGK